MNFDKIKKKTVKLHRRDLDSAIKKLAGLYKLIPLDKQKRGEITLSRLECQEAEKVMLARHEREFDELKLSYVTREINLIQNEGKKF